MFIEVWNRPIGKADTGPGAPYFAIAQYGLYAPVMCSPRGRLARIHLRSRAIGFANTRATFNMLACIAFRYAKLDDCVASIFGSRANRGSKRGAGVRNRLDRRAMYR